MTKREILDTVDVLHVKEKRTLVFFLYFQSRCYNLCDFCRDFLTYPLMQQHSSGLPVTTLSRVTALTCKKQGKIMDKCYSC